MRTSEAKLLEIKKYVEENYIEGFDDSFGKKCRISSNVTAPYSLADDVESLQRKIKRNVSDTWQRALFNIIDSRFLNEVECYKRAYITKQTFSKIRSDENYHPDKDTAIRMCIGLKLNLDDTLDLLSKAGYTLSPSIERDLVVRYFIESKEYSVIDIDIALEDLGMKQFLKY